jgi:hypothetical protein
MVDQELIERVTRLPISQRLALIELLSHSLREDLAAAANEPARGSAPSSDEMTGGLAAIRRLAESLNIELPLDSSLHRLRGVVSSGAVPTTKDELRDLVADFLLEKHS